MKNLYTTSQVVALSGVTSRQVQWWVGTGLIATVKQPTAWRVFTHREAAKVLVFADLKRRSISLNLIRRASRLITKLLSEIDDSRVVCGGGIYLIFDSKANVDIANGDSSFAEVVSGRATPFTVIDLSEIWGKLAGHALPT